MVRKAVSFELAFLSEVYPSPSHHYKISCLQHATAPESSTCFKRIETECVLDVQYPEEMLDVCVFFAPVAQ